MSQNDYQLLLTYVCTSSKIPEKMEFLFPNCSSKTPGTEPHQTNLNHMIIPEPNTEVRGFDTLMGWG